jgi:ubiquinone biosynthesis protein
VAAPQIRHPSFFTRLRSLERMREITAVAVKHGFGYFFERHRLQTLLPIGRRRHEHLPAQRGKHVREMLDELGPTFVKFGQVLSTRPDIVPKDIVEELVKLQDMVTPLPFSVVEQVIQEELGLRVDRAFESFEAEPMASASIGQVHGAILPGGQRVVVKIQRPEAARSIRRDIDLMLQLAEILEHRVDLGFSPIGVVQEFARSTSRELDYGLEARNAIRFALNLRDNENVVIPRIFSDYSTTRVLTMTRIDGYKLTSPEVLALPAAERKLLAENIAECWFRQVLDDGFVHADPHPANLVSLGAGRFGILDFGMTGTLRSDDLEEGTRLFQAAMRSDVPGIKRALKRLGTDWNPSSDEMVSELIEESFGRYFGVSVSDVDVSAMFHEVFDVIYSLRLRLPTRFLLLDKAALTLEGVISQLAPDVNLFDVARRLARDFKARLADPRRIADRARRRTAEFAYLLADYPVMLHDLIEEARSGELEIRYRHTGLEEVIHRLDLLMNRLVVALVSIALGVTGTAAALVIQDGPQVAGISAWGLPGFAGSLFFGVWLIWSILRSGRL